MTTREERVRLTLDDAGFSTSLAKDAAAVAAFARMLDTLDGKNIDVDRSLASAAVQARNLGDEVNRTGSEIDRLSGRMGIFRDIALTLGPALSPIGAVGIAGLAGLANQLGFTAVAAGTMVVAFQGVGDALSKVNKAALQPTEANIANAKLAMQQLSPVARDLVDHLQELRPIFKELQGTAQQGMFPGLMRGLDSLVEVGPQVESVLHVVSKTLGDLFERTGEDLASGRWDDFFQMLASEARPTLEKMGSTIGHLAHGMAELWEAFAPLNRDFGDWLAGTAREFDHWSKNLSATAGFQDFVDFIRESGPQVGEAMGAIANALIKVSEAMGPLGGVSLQLITSLANALAKLADSDLGTPLLATAAGIAAISRAVQLLNRTGITGATGAAAQGGLIAGLIGPNPAKSRAALQGIKADVQTIGAVWGTAGARTAREQERLSRGYESLRKDSANFAGQAMRVAGPLAGLAAQSGLLGDSLEQSNSAIFAMYGSMAGPWGAAIGGAVGLVSDFAAANDRLQESIDNAKASADAFDLGAMRKNLEGLQSAMQADSDKVSPDSFQDFISAQFDVQGALARTDQLAGQVLGNLWTSAGEKATEEYEALAQQTEDLASAQRMVAKGVDGDLAPAMERLGITTKDVYAAFAADKFLGTMGIDGGQMDALIDRLQRAADKVGLLGTKARLTAEDIAGMNNAMQEMTDNALGAANASLAYRQAMADATQAIKDNGKHWRDGTQNARDNEAALQDLAGAWNNQSQVVQDNVHKWAAARDNFIDTAVAMGATREAAERMADSWIHLPEIKKMKLQLDDGEFVQGTKQAMKAFKSLPPEVRTNIRANGIPQTMGEVNALVKRYELTEKQRQALVTLLDHASPTIQGIQRLLNILDRTNPTPNVTVTGADAAIANARGVQSALAGIRDKTVTITTFYNTVRGGAVSSAGGHEAPAVSADGGMVPDAPGPYRDMFPYLLAPRERVISNRHGQADAFAPLLDRINQWRPGQGLANGGTTGTSPGPTTGLNWANISPWVLMAQATEQATSTIQEWGHELHTSSLTQRDLRKIELQDRRRHLSELLKLQEKERDALKERLDALRQERQSLIEGVASIVAAGHDLLGGVRTAVIPGLGSTDEISFADGPATFASFSAALNAQFGTAAELKHVLAVFKRKHLGPELLQWLITNGADIATLEDFASQSAADLQAISAQFSQVNQFTHAVGNQAFGVAGGAAEMRQVHKSLDAVNAAIRDLHETEKRIDKKLDHLKHLDETGPERTGRAVADAEKQSRQERSRTASRRATR